MLLPPCAAHANLRGIGVLSANAVDVSAGFDTVVGSVVVVAGAVDSEARLGDGLDELHAANDARLASSTMPGSLRTTLTLPARSFYCDAVVLTDAQRAQYRHDGWLSVPALVDETWLARVRAVTAEFVEQSRALTESNLIFDLDSGHSATEPRLRRLSSPTDLHDTYWEFASRSVIVDVVADLVGPDVVFHHSKLNFKAPHGGEEVKWHQDIQFWPHTNYDLLTIGVFLDDVHSGMGEVGFVPGSHDGPLYDLYDGDVWVGALDDRDVAAAGIERAQYPTGPAGTITVHNCRTVHGSAPNRSDRGRPLLLCTYAPADAFAYTDLVRRSPHGSELIRGAPARWARHDPRPCLMPPNGPYRPIFAAQQREGLR